MFLYIAGTASLSLTGVCHHSLESYIDVNAHTCICCSHGPHMSWTNFRVVFPTQMSGDRLFRFELVCPRLFSCKARIFNNLEGMESTTLHLRNHVHQVFFLQLPVLYQRRSRWVADCLFLRFKLGHCKGPALDGISCPSNSLGPQYPNIVKDPTKWLLFHKVFESKSVSVKMPRQ